jgi:sensor histidine kinase YesM
VQTAPAQLPVPFEAAVGDTLRPQAPAALLRRPHAPVGVWRVIWVIGGISWLGVTCIALFWLRRWAGTIFEGEYVASLPAHAVGYAFIFLGAALAYRVASALGWPATARERAVTVVIHLLLVFAFLLWSELVDALSAGLVDQHYADMRLMLAYVPAFFTSLKPWAASLRFLLPPYVLGLALVLLVQMAEQRRQDALQAAELARRYSETRLAMLSAQLQPHFLFNALNAIMGLIDENPAQASTMTARLGDFLRHALETSQSPWVTVAVELAGLEAYLAVQQVRFGEQLRVSILATAEARGIRVPSLLLQPLAENAIQHGRISPVTPLSVEVLAAVRGARLHLAVRSSSVRLTRALSPAEFGCGLRNVRARLDAAYGADARLTVGPDPAGGTLATLDLPLPVSSGAAGSAAVAP